MWGDETEDFVEAAPAFERDDWSRAPLTTEFELVDGVRYRVVKQTRTYQKKRPYTMVDHRATLAKFGQAIDKKEGTVALDPIVVLELGQMDPVEKQVRDEITRMWSEVEKTQVTVKDPNLRATQQAKAEAPAPAAAPSPTAEEGKKTWGQASKEKRDAGAPVAKDTGDTLSKSVVRISNLSDFITEGELRTLFGPENKLPPIVKVFVAKDKTTGQRRGFAYITYGSDADGEKVVQKMARTPFKNTILTVDFGTNRK